jgi:hypothetical protein
MFSNMVFFTARERRQSAEMEGGKIREHVRRDFNPRRQSQDYNFRQPRAENLARGGPQDSAGAAESVVGSLLKRVSETTLKEVDHLIAELQARREKLFSESAHVQREIIDFAKMSHSTMQAAKIIAETLTYWNKIPQASVAETDIKRRERNDEPPLRDREDIGASIAATADVPDHQSAEPGSSEQQSSEEQLPDTTVLAIE